ncbi:unnamed protein product, partial [Bubo scandiacus]
VAAECMANRPNVSLLHLVKSCELHHLLKPTDLTLTWWSINCSEMKNFRNNEDECN